MTWFVMGGVPVYLVWFQTERTCWENVREQLLKHEIIPVFWRQNPCSVPNSAKPAIT